MAGDRVRKNRKQREASVSGNLATQVVCTSQGATTSKNSVELGLVFSLLIVGLYLYGFFETFSALPDVATGRQLGTNLNIAKLQHENTNTEAVPHVDVKVPAMMAKEEMNDGNGNGFGDIPHGTWPVSLRDELNDYEILIHPGDKKTKMSVPKFWSPPLHNKRQFTRKQAMLVGTCVEPDPETGSQVRGENCPDDQRTIFVAIASYRDYQCRYTVESVFNRAKNPERVRVAIVDQIIEGEDAVCNDPIEPCDTNPNQALCKYKDQVDILKMEAQLSVGPVVARHLGHRMYRGEYYSTQSDAHVTYTQNWDSDIIEQMVASHDEMAVLSTYLTDVQGSIDPVTGVSLRRTRPIMCNTYYEGGAQGPHLRHGSQPERMPGIHGTPQLQPWWAAGYSFSRGHFVVNVPYDPYQPMIFQGEEMSIGIRGFTIGYDFYAPERSVCFHHYATGKNAQLRNKVKHFWENGDLYAGTGQKAMARLLGIVHMNPEVDPSKWDHTEEDVYGLGGVRSPEQFYELFGINVIKKETEGHLCQFVDTDGRMHKTFFPHLRSDGMGIDYTDVHFKWVDPIPAAKKHK